MRKKKEEELIENEDLGPLTERDYIEILMGLLTIRVTKVQEIKAKYSDDDPMIGVMEVSMLSESQQQTIVNHILNKCGLAEVEI